MQLLLIFSRKVLNLTHQVSKQLLTTTLLISTKVWCLAYACADRILNTFLYLFICHVLPQAFYRQK